MTVVRIFGFPVEDGFQLQMQPGVYNETAFLGLDTVIYEASRAGLRVIIVLANNWDYCGDWKCAYANFSATVRDCDDFFTDPVAIQHYKRHAERMLMRVNHLTGVAYAHDPTIFGLAHHHGGTCQAAGAQPARHNWAGRLLWESQLHV
ncbi:hypothetical protein CVIRNUC_008534 [Coccomyxa viridis]|uniref:mannan endo-1,4-beta-mannosidase n=1 Tax=Coccomyxa viridis TaxID=1274662 RepID=A0AAV1IDT4_9CHLO|nr:hypothetical protein CVIRNUC_008534 [Coccomyxa viridis]